MRIGITGLIAVAMMLAMMPSATAYAVDLVGQIEYEDGTPCDSLGWTVCGDNLNQTYWPDVWCRAAYGDGGYIIWDYLVTGRAESEDDYLYINVTSSDGKWYGEGTVQLKDVWDPVWSSYIIDLVVSEVTVEPDTFTMSLPLGWNLISLPLTPLDSSTSAVLGNATIAYDAVKQYDATTKTFADATTMDPGTGYFVHVTTAGDWVYEGTSVSSVSPGLKSGLNMIGVPNCTMSVDAAMGSADYRYVARWNADDQKYEVYNPSAPAAFYGFTEMTAGEGYFVSATIEDGAFEINC